jgi:hypothetical protein
MLSTSTRGNVYISEKAVTRYTSRFNNNDYDYICGLKGGIRLVSEAFYHGKEDCNQALRSLIGSPNLRMHLIHAL